MTSHAAVVARGMGKCCVSGAGTLKIDYAAKVMEVDGLVVKEGDYIYTPCPYEKENLSQFFELLQLLVLEQW